MTRRRLAVALLAVLTAAGGCSSDEPSGDADRGGSSTTASTIAQTSDRAAVLTAVATKVIEPAYRELAEQAAELEAATAACDLERSREAWKATRVAFSRTYTASGLGPAKDQRLLPAIDFWPSDPAGVEAYAAGPGPFTIEALQALGARQRGLNALETLLFGRASLEGQRCRMATLISALVHRATGDVAKAWADLAPRFASQDRALAELVSSATQAMSHVEGVQLGMPVGLRRGLMVNPALVRGVNALQDAAAVAAGTMSVLQVGVAPLLPRELTGRLLAGIEAAENAVGEVPEPLQEAITSARAQVLTAIQRAKAVEQLLATEVTSVLGITLNFNPNDGD